MPAGRSLFRKSVRWVGTSARNEKTYDFLDMPLKNADGSISRLEIFRDITERMRVEEALRESEERYRMLFSESQRRLLCLRADPWRETTENIEFNDNLNRMLVISREESAVLSFEE